MSATIACEIKTYAVCDGRQWRYEEIDASELNTIPRTVATVMQSIAPCLNWTTHCQRSHSSKRAPGGMSTAGAC